MKKVNVNLSIPKKQSGVILVLALVILLVLTLLVVSSMNATNTQVLMTGNTQYHTQALNDAETALRFAESSIDQIILNGSAKPATGYYDLKVSNTNAIDFSNFSWTSTTAAKHKVGSRSSLYVIEYTGGEKISFGGNEAVTQNDSIPGEEYHLFRVTARSTSARGAIRIVQSVYATDMMPN